MNEMVTIPKAEYEALISMRDDVQDYASVKAYLDNAADSIPSQYVKRIIAGESPLAVLREWRGFNQSSLAKASGVNRTYLADIEAGRKNGSVHALRKLSAALDVTIEDLI